MWFPVLSGTIDRRILINYQVDGDVVGRYLPPAFRPALIEGKALVGVCLIRLKHVRPKGWPRMLGIASENGAHRIAVEWTDDAGVKAGVYILRRDTSAMINTWAGGRVFPGVHHRARFTVKEGDGRYAVSFKSEDGTALQVKAVETEQWSGTSLFPDPAAASRFMEKGAKGYSPGRSAGPHHGLELRTMRWHTTPLEVTELGSSFFQDEAIFPKGTVRFDSALLMRDIQHEWHSARPLPQCT